MALRGQSKSQKALSAPTVRHLNRKAHAWTSRSIPGPHNKERSVPLVFVVRDLLKLAGNEKEVRAVLHNTEVKVNGVRRMDLRFAVGLFDAVDLVGIKKRYRVVFDKKGRIKLVEAKGGDKLSKLCKVLRKHTMKGGKQQLTLDDGTTLTDEKNAIKVGSTLKVELPSHKVLEVLELKKGNVVYVTQGTHVGAVAQINDVIAGTMSRPKLISLKATGETGEEFQTVERNVLVVGTKKPEIEVE